MSDQSLKKFWKGARDGFPIFLGYVPVSFAFGMMATEGGLPFWTAVLISMTNFTSAGQVAGTSLILSGAAYLEIGITTFVINIRYMLMSLSLSQKLEEKMSTLARCVLSFGNTDEIFAVAMQQEGRVGTSYLAGLIATPYLGWTLGTVLGAGASGLLPLSLRTALGILIYGMFIAIMIPPARKVRSILMTVCIAAALSCVIRWVPWLSWISGGWSIILCAVAASAVVALRYPVADEEAMS